MPSEVPEASTPSGEELTQGEASTEATGSTEKNETSREGEKEIHSTTVLPDDVVAPGHTSPRRVPPRPVLPDPRVTGELIDVDRELHDRAKELFGSNTTSGQQRVTRQEVEDVLGSSLVRREDEVERTQPGGSLRYLRVLLSSIPSATKKEAKAKIWQVLKARGHRTSEATSCDEDIEEMMLDEMLGKVLGFQIRNIELRGTAPWGNNAAGMVKWVFDNTTSQNDPRTHGRRSPTSDNVSERRDRQLESSRSSTGLDVAEAIAAHSSLSSMASTAKKLKVPDSLKTSQEAIEQFRSRECFTTTSS